MRLLDAEGPVGDPQGALHGPVQVEHHPGFDELFHLVHHDLMAAGHFPQGGHLALGVVEDVQVRVQRASFVHVVDEVAQRLPFLLQALRGEGYEVVPVRGVLDEAEEVLDAALPRRRVLPEGSPS